MPLNITNEILFAPINIKLFLFCFNSIIICATSSDRKGSTFSIHYVDKLFLFFKYYERMYNIEIFIKYKSARHLPTVIESIIRATYVLLKEY